MGQIMAEERSNRRWVLSALAILVLLAVVAVVKRDPSLWYWYDWNGKLHAALDGSTTLVVRPTPSFAAPHIDPLGEVRDAAAVQELVDLFEIDARASGSSCKCEGELRLEFGAADRDTIVIEFAHGKRVKWSEFPCDGVLTDASSAAVRRWLNTRARGR